MENETFAVSDERKIRALIEQWKNALHEKDVGKLMSFYAPNVMLFDIAPPLRYSSTETLRKSLKEWFSSFDGPIGYEFTELEIVTGREVAFLYSISHLTGKRTNGEQTDVWMRVTMGLSRVNDRWLIQHEHSSVPLYMDGSNRAAVDLKP